MSDSTATNPLKRAGEAAPEPLPENKKSKGADDPTASGSMDVEDDEVDDDLAEIDANNIISGPRTRGKKIDFTKVPMDDADPEEDDDDEDAVVGDETMEMDDEEEESAEDDEDEEAA